MLEYMVGLELFIFIIIGLKILGFDIIAILMDKETKN